MATAIGNSTMRRWGPRGPYSTILPRRHPLFSPRAGDCPCRVWIEGEHGVTKPRQWYRYVSNMRSGSKVQKRRLYLMCGWPLSPHLRDGATSTLRAICGGRPRGESSPRRPEDPQDKSQAPGKEAPEGQKERFTPRGGGARPQRVCTLGFRVFFVAQRISVRWLPGPQ